MFGDFSDAAETDEYIVFNPNNIKSADIVSFEDDENDEGYFIPLSERFNPNNEDIRYYLKRRTKEAPVLST